jgi:DNA-binding response OmpR family regulator
MYKIFIIEDDEIVAEVYKDKLQAEGYTVEVAHDGESGYFRLKAFEPDLLLLDMMVPELAGVDVIRMLRSKDAFKDLCIIAFSGSAELLDEAKRLGATRVLSKGEYLPNQIVARITEVIAGVRKVGESEAVFLHTLAEWVPPSGRVLVVDDDPIMIQLVKDVIEEEGYTVVSAKDGQEAFRILGKDNKFVAGIFDVKMPTIQGTDLLRYMHTEKRLMKIPVLIMTSEQSMAVRTESLDAGAAIFLPKPFTCVTLRTMFRALIASKGSKKEPESFGGINFEIRDRSRLRALIPAEW